ncbi:MAG: ATP-binding protein [Rhodocyclaceae bacterium]
MTKLPFLSLRARLLALLLGSMALVWSLLVVASYFDSRHEIGEVLDAHLAQSAALLVAQTGYEMLHRPLPDTAGLPMRRGKDHDHDQDDDHERGDDERRVEIVAPAHRYERRVVFQIWDAGGNLRLRSAGSPKRRLSPQEQGFSDVLLEDDSWRVFSLRDPGKRFVVQVGEHEHFRDELAEKIAENMLSPLKIALPVLAFLLWIGVGRGLAPLAEINRQLARRAPDRLEAVDAGSAPAEVRPLVITLNKLLEKVRTALENERRFTADAAHELRTPLAALKTQAQVALAARDVASRQHALRQVLTGCDRASHLVEQMLTLARLDPQAGTPTLQPVDLRRVAAEVIGDLTEAALAKDIDLGLDGNEALMASGDGAMLAVLLRNLVDNAVRYTPRGGTVAVGLQARPEGPALVVTDNGPGIATDDRERVGRRFYRVLGTGENGSGLGLSIVQRICELHGARLSLEPADQERGLRVVVAFPPVH